MAILWIKLQADIVEHPKFIGLSNDAKWAFVEMMIYAQRNLSDGFIDGRVMRGKWSESVIQELMNNDKDSPSLAAIGEDYQLHNYSKYQRSRAEVESIVEKRKEAGSRGGISSAQVRASRTEANAKQSASKTEAKSNPDTDTDTEKGVVIQRTRKTPLQRGWKPSPAGYEYAKAKAPGMNIEKSLEDFEDYNLRNNRTNADWEAAWRTWVRKSIEFDPLLAQPVAPPKRDFTTYRTENV